MMSRIRSSYLHALICISLLFLFGQQINAQSYNFTIGERNQTRTAQQIKNDNGFPFSFEVVSDRWTDIVSMGPSWTNRMKYKSIQSFVQMSVRHNHPVKINDSYTFRMMYMVKGFTNPLDTTMSQILFDTLTISYKPDSLAAYQDINLKRYTGFHKIRITFLELYEITNATSPPVPVDMTSNGGFTRFNFEVKGGIIPQPFDKEIKVTGPSGTSYTNVYGINAPALNVEHGTAQNDILPIRWNVQNNYMNNPLLITPAKYELEWQYIDNYDIDPDNSTVGEFSAASLRYDFRNNGTRVTIDSNHFNIPLIYQKGYVVYRVRMVRPDSAQYRFPIYGRWSINNESGALSSLSATNHYFKINSAHSNDSLNWQYTVSFAEQGKYKHVLSYYDGMLKDRQRITRYNSSPNKLIAIEPIYDYEGRPSLNILPTPIHSEKFAYQYGLSLNSTTGLPYSAEDFDAINPDICPGDELLAPLAQNALANLYYSGLNPDTAGFQKFVPDAEGYPFLQTKFSPGFEDRIDKRGGAGQILQIGNNHNTRNVYVSGDQADLNRVFGLNVGLSGFYRKIITKDQNGQLSLTYTDFRGNTVANSLFGIPDTGSLAIQPNLGAPDTSMFSEDHILGMAQQQYGNKKVLDKVYYNDVAGNNNFEYQTSFTPFPTFCPDKFLSVASRYFYNVTDECGNLVVEDVGVLGQTGVVNDGNPIAAGGGVINAFLEDGSHAIHKELSFSAADAITAVDTYMDMPDNCLRSENDFIKEEVFSRTYPCSHSGGCYQCRSRCDVLKERMMRELWPNLNNAYAERKYGYYTGLSWPYFSNQNSIFTIVNGTTGQIVSPDNWELFAQDTTNYYRYQDPCLVTLPDTVIRFGRIYTNLQALSVDTFITIFNDDIAEALLPLHPEYCDLLKCADDPYKKYVNEIPDAIVAEELGILILSGLIANDPLAERMYNLGMNAEDSLSHVFSTHFSIDSMAMAQVYCQCGDEALYMTCLENVFTQEIANSILSVQYTKDKYFEKIKMLYFSNRQHYVKYLIPIDEPLDCPTCLAVRMTGSESVVFTNPIDYSNPYTGGSFGVPTGSLSGTYPFMVSQQFFDAIPPADSVAAQEMADFMSVLNDTASALNYATNLYNTNMALLNGAAVDYIIEKLVNCADSATLQILRNQLMEMIATGVVSQGKFTPQHIRNAIVGAGISLSDLCHPYLISYNDVNPYPTSKFSCNAGFHYQQVQDIVNHNSFKNALINIGGEFGMSLTNANGVQTQITTQLGANNFRVSATHNSALGLYTVSLYNISANESGAVKFYFRTNDPAIGCNQPFDVAAGNMSILVDCINIAPFAGNDQGANVEGYIGAFTFYAKVEKNTGAGTTVCHLAAWNNTIMMNKTNMSNIAGCVPCTEMEQLHNRFMDNMSDYGMVHVDHPYYNTALRNFMNYSLKATYQLDDYLPFMESCALADNKVFPKQVGYATVLFSNNSAANDFLDGLGQIDNTIDVYPHIRYRQGNNELLIMDFNYLPVSLWKVYKDFINGYTNSVLQKQVNASYFNVEGTNNNSLVLFTPTPIAQAHLTAMQSASGFALVANGSVNWFNGTAYQTAYRTNVITTAASPIQISQGLAKVLAYQYENGLNAYVAEKYQHTVNDQYYMPEKKAYMDYVNQFSSQHKSLVLDTIRGEVLQSEISMFNNHQLQYGTLRSPAEVQHLYMINPDVDVNDTEYEVLVDMLNKVSLYYGGSQRLFGTAMITTILSGNKYNLYHNSDKSYWYRYFDDNDKLYNVFIHAPKYISPTDLTQYQMVNLELVPGDDSTTSFRIRMRRPGGLPEVIWVNGYTDFNIGNSKSLKNVLLRDLHYNPKPNNLDNCEHQKLNAAIYEGKVRYIMYRDSIRTQLINDFTAYVLQGVQESLISSYRTQRFNYTVYEYDRAQNLIRTVPPAGVQFLTGNALNQVNGLREAGIADTLFLPAHQKASDYKYNSLNQMISEYTPDAGRTDFFYDRAGRIVFSQNEQQRIFGKMTYTLHDAQNRIIEKGQAKIACTPYFTPYPGNNDSLLQHNCAHNNGGTISPFPLFIQNLKNATNQQITDYVRSLAREEVVLTHYDQNVIALNTYQLSPQENLRKRVSTIKFFSVLQSGNTTFNNYDYAMHFSYDITGNVKTLTRDFPAWEPAGQRFKRVDYDYDLISGKVNLLSYNRGFADQFYQKYGYDDDNRITKVETSSDGMIWNRDAAYEYYQHGPLARMSLGERRVQGIDYAYTIQGWLKAINGDILAPAEDMGNDNLGNNVHARDAVALTFDYFNGDYKPIGNTTVINAPAGIKNMYNGNIPRTTSAIMPFENLSANYTYDQLNRLVQANYAALAQDTQWNATQKYYNSYAYDADGNLQKLVRNGDNNNTLAMDSIIYRYTVGNKDNRLQNVNDYVPDNYSNDIRQNTITNVSRYMYDATGNLIKDLVSGQDTIQWNHFNKVSQVVQNGPDSTVIRFDYDGLEQRYMKTNVIARADTTIEKGEYYVRDINGNILAVYKAESRYEMSPTTVWEQVLYPALTYVGPTAFISNYLAPAYGNNGGFMNYMVGQGMDMGLQESIINDHPPSYFLANNQALYSGYLTSYDYSQELFRELYDYTIGTGDTESPLAEAMYNQSKHDPETFAWLMRSLFGTPDRDDIRATAITALWYGQQNNAASIYAPLGFEYDPNDEGANIEHMRTFLESSDENFYALMDLVNAYILQADPEIGLNFFKGIALNEHMQHVAIQEYPELMGIQQHVMITDGYKPLFGAFADQWGAGTEVLMGAATPDAFLQASYAANTGAFIDKVYEFSGNNNGVLLGGISAAYNGSFSSNIFHIHNGLVAHLNYLVPVTVWQELLKYQDLHLSSHHLYGSSRLGTRDYLSGQLYSRIDMTGNQPIMDTMMLTARRPWYSHSYDDLIGGGSNIPWGMADQGAFHMASQIGQKQYELSNHLGNVQATVSDLPFRNQYIPPGIDTLIETTQPALVSAYDYYPFGMLMPGRFVTDTSSQWMTVSRSNWTTVMVDTCYTSTALATSSWMLSTIGNATYSSNGLSLTATAPRNTDMLVVNQNVASGKDNIFAVDIEKLSGFNDEGVIVTVTETINGMEYVIGGGRIGNGRGQKIPFKPTMNNVSIKIAGPFTHLELTKICTQVPKSVQHTYLVDVYDKSDDRYRFGFNGMEKDNDIKGIGNSLDFGARMYDSRIGKFLSLDPLAKQFSWNSPYSFAENDVIRAVDENGEKRLIIHEYTDSRTGKTFKTMNTAEGLMLVIRPERQTNMFGGVSTSYTEYYDWHDYTTTYSYSYDSKTQISTLKSRTDEKGARRGSSLSSRLNPFRVTTEAEAIKRYDSPKQENPFWKSIRERTRGGGIQWTSKNWTFPGQTTEYNARALYPDGRSESLDDLVAPGADKIKSIGDAVRYLNDGIKQAKSLQDVEWLKLNGGKSESGETRCPLCNEAKDSTHIDQLNGGGTWNKLKRQSNSKL